MLSPTRLTQMLRERLCAIHVEVIDDSAQHAGHAQAQQSGGGHYTVTIVSDQFTGKSLLERHRAVYDALREEMTTAIHALTIQALSPSEWSRRASSSGDIR